MPEVPAWNAYTSALSGGIVLLSNAVTKGPMSNVETTRTLPASGHAGSFPPLPLCNRPPKPSNINLFDAVVWAWDMPDMGASN